MNAMILAAGLGTRLRPFTNIYPKPAIPFLNVPMIYWALEIVNLLQCQKTVINTHHLPEAIHQLFPCPQWTKSDIIFSHESPHILGTGGGVEHARKFLEDDDDFIVLNGDTIFIPSQLSVLEKMMSFHKKQKALATFLVREHNGETIKGSGIWSNANHEVMGVGTQSPAPHTKNWHWVGYRIFSKRIFDYLPRGESQIFKDALLPALKKGERAYTFVDDCLWFETGNLKDYILATQEALQALTRPTKQYPLLEKIIQKYSSSIWQETSQQLKAPNCKILPPFAQEGFCVIGEGAHIESECYLNNTVIGPKVQIPKGARFENQLVLASPQGNIF